MERVKGYDGRTVSIHFSKGNGVPYLESWEDNVLREPHGGEWPSFLLKQVHHYVARRSWFAEKDADALASRLGRISKFQSLNSEDALTWSWFGTLGLAEPQVRRRTVQWLYDRLGIALEVSSNVHISQWARVIHPNAPMSLNGPEVDAQIEDPDVALTYVEAKWNAPLGKGKGATAGVRDDQIVLRRDALRALSAQRGHLGTLIVLGVSQSQPSLALYHEDVEYSAKSAVQVAWLTWSELAECETHPLAEDFRRYLEWKDALLRRSLPGADR